MLEQVHSVGTPLVTIELYTERQIEQNASVYKLREPPGKFK